MLWHIKGTRLHHPAPPSTLQPSGIPIFPSVCPFVAEPQVSSPPPVGNVECLGPTSTPSSFIFQANVLCQTTGLSTVWLQEQCFHQHAPLQPGQGAGEVLQDQLRLQRLRRRQQPPRVRETGHRSQSARTEGHVAQRLRRYDKLFVFV